MHKKQLVEKRGHYEKSPWTKCIPGIWLQQLLCHGPSPTTELSCCLLLVVHTAQPALSVPLPAESTACAELAPSGRGVPGNCIPVPALVMQSPATKRYTAGGFKFYRVVSGLIRQIDLAKKKPSVIAVFMYLCIIYVLLSVGYFGSRKHSWNVKRWILVKMACWTCSRQPSHSLKLPPMLLHSLAKVQFVIKLTSIQARIFFIWRSLPKQRQWLH